MLASIFILGKLYKVLYSHNWNTVIISKSDAKLIVLYYMCIAKYRLFQFDMVDIFSSGVEVDQCLLNYPPFRCHLRVTVQIRAYFSHSLFSIFLLMFEFTQQS